jgi:hypothetical protein
MRRYNTNVAFNDFLFLLLLGFVALLFIAFLLINPIAREAIVDPKTQLIVLIEWPKKSIVDIDLWVRGPDGTTVGYKNKDGKYIVLERDDLGTSNDTVFIDGEERVVYRNIETTIINKLFPGEYVINIHNFSSDNRARSKSFNEEYPTPVKIRIIKVDPYAIVYEKNIVLKFRQEKTMLTFEVTKDNAIADKRTDVTIPLYK